MKEINIYIMTSAKSPKTQTARFLYILELITPKGPATLTQSGEITGTKNQIELRALTKALQRVNKPVAVILYTDSDYISSAITMGWIEKWKENGWKTARGKPVSNAGEWREVLILLFGKEFMAKVKQDHPYKKWMQKEIQRMDQK